MTLRVKFREAGRYGLVAPLLVLLTITFMVPLAMVLWTSVSDKELSTALPGVAALVKRWDGTGPLPPETQDVLASQIREAAPEKVAALGRRLSYEDPKLATLLRTTARTLRSDPGTAAEIDPRWADIKTWQVLKRAAGPIDGFLPAFRPGFAVGVWSRPPRGQSRWIVS